MLNNRKINTIAGIILPVVVMIMTAALFFMFKPQETTALFYINLCYVIFLEAVFFGYLNLFRAKTEDLSDLSTPYLSIFGVFSVYYIILGLVWLFVYSLILLNYMPLKLYAAGLMILTLLWILVSVLTEQTDSNYRQTVDRQKEQSQSLDFYSQKITLLASRYAKLCDEKGLKYETESNNRTALDRLMGKIKFLTPNVLRNETATVQITSLLSKCEDIIEETELATEDNLALAHKKMQRFVDNAVAEIDMLKNLTKR